MEQLRTGCISVTSQILPRGVAIRTGRTTTCSAVFPLAKHRPNHNQEHSFGRRGADSYSASRSLAKTGQYALRLVQQRAGWYSETQPVGQWRKIPRRPRIDNCMTYQQHLFAINCQPVIAVGAWWRWHSCRKSVRKGRTPTS